MHFLAVLLVVAIVSWLPRGLPAGLITKVSAFDRQLLSSKIDRKSYLDDNHHLDFQKTILDVVSQFIRSTDPKPSFIDLPFDASLTATT
jgi:hypothetical protein